MLNVLQIVPRLKPSIDGVGDYALTLARRLRAQHNVDTVFLVCDPEWRGDEKIDDFLIFHLNDRSVSSFKRILESIALIKKFKTIILQYVGYGYEKRGCPLWLAGGINSVVGFNLITVFHEIYAFSIRPWTSSFWNGWLQKKVARQILFLSNYVVTNNSSYAHVLKKMKPKSNPRVFLNFSNVGESERVIEWGRREHISFLFGAKKNFFLKKWKKILAKLTEFKIEKNYVLGRNSLNVKINGVAKSLNVCGALHEKEIHILLSKGMIGFVDCPSDKLGKSGVFAAYCSHGVVPIIGKLKKTCDGITEGVHFFSLERFLKGGLRAMDLELVSKNAFEWYQAHNVDVVASGFSALICDN